MSNDTDCSICYKPCTKEQKALECDLCDSWVHISCEGISTKSYLALGEIKNVWFCNACSNKFRENKSIKKEEKFVQTDSVADQFDMNYKFKELETLLVKKIEKIVSMINVF